MEIIKSIALTMQWNGQEIILIGNENPIGAIVKIIMKQYLNENVPILIENGALMEVLLSPI